MDVGLQKSDLCLNSLPFDPLLHIMSYLNYRDLTSFGTVSHKFRELSHTNSHWKRQCIIYFGIKECPDEKEWRELFIDWFSDFGRYIDIYMTVRKAWTQIESYLETNCSAILRSLQDGASDADLDLHEKRMGLTMPLDFRCIYRIHDGQNLKCNLDRSGLFGTIRSYDHRRCELMLPLQGMNRDSELLSYPVTCCNYTQVVQCLAAADEHGLRRGQLYYQMGKRNSESFFISGESYLKWFTDYAQDLAADRFVREDGTILRFYDDPKAVATTEHVCIAVSTAFVPELSRVSQRDTPSCSMMGGMMGGTQLVHAYRVTISMKEDVPKRYACQLETRHWIITDGNGEVSEVKGRGVIGEYPVIKPGTSYSYISCTHFETDTGTMKGTFTMKNFATEEKFEAEVPEFHMRTYPYVCSTDPPVCLHPGH